MKKSQPQVQEGQIQEFMPAFFCAHFESASTILDSSDKIIFRLNSFLPNDISVNAIRKVLPDANARFSALSRTYKYYISRIKDPFFDHSSWFLHGNINLEIMNQACQILFSHSDFTSFSKLHSDTKTNICRIFEAEWVEDENRLVFTIKADRFLRNMVRAIVGTMVEIGIGKIELKKFDAIILRKIVVQLGYPHLRKDCSLSALSILKKFLFRTRKLYASCEVVSLRCKL